MTRVTIAWCLYDLANTIFAINMTSYHFPVWVVSERGAGELLYSLAFGGSMLVSAFLMPWLGARSDRRGKRVPPLAAWTLLCVALTSSLTFIWPLWAALLIFALANLAYQIAGIFYNALLPVVTPSDRIGRTSGYGVALGYVGTLIGILAVQPFVLSWGRQAAFLPTGLLFLLLALPCFLCVKEQPFGGVPPGVRPFEPKGAGPTRPLDLGNRGLIGFLWAAFWCLSSVSTVILFMSVYAKEAIGFDDATLHRFLLTATSAAILGSLGWGWITDRFGGFRSLFWVWWIWSAVFLLACLSFHPLVFWILGSIAGVALGGSWVCSRVLLVELVGPARLGEAFGKFGLISRLSAILGPVVWGTILWIATPLGPFRYRLGMLSLLGFMLLGLLLYRRIRPGRG